MTDNLKDVYTQIMQTQLNRMAFLLKDPLSEESFTKLYGILKTYNFYLQNLQLEVKALIKINVLKCSSCMIEIPKNNSAIKLTCNHLICTNDCLQNLIKTCTKSDIEKYCSTICQSCGKSINESILIDSFGGINALELLIKEARYQRAPKFECPICYRLILVEEGITLSCDHRFCNKCISAHSQQAVKEKKIIKEYEGCPLCGQNISINIRRHLLDQNEFKVYDDLLFRTYEPDPAKQEGFIFRCIRENCDFTAILPNGLKKIKCKNCNRSYCTICRKRYHPKFTCEEIHDATQNKQVLKLAKELGWKACPYCKNMCERISGCNFMRCMSKECAGMKNFCYLCGNCIRDYSHFEIEGPFGKTCNGLRPKENNIRIPK